MSALYKSSMSKDRNDRGQFTEQVTLADVLGVFDLVEGPVVTSGDVAEETGCSRDSARRKLAQLAERDQVESRTTAGRDVYWRTNDAGPAPVDPDDPIFVDRPTFNSGRGDLSANVDELLYGENA